MQNEENEETMTICYNQKKSKYMELVQACNQQFHKETHLIVIIVSSLGAIYNKSIAGMKKLLGLQGKRHNKHVKTLLRRMSLASCIGSYFIYYKIRFSETNRFRGLDDEEGRGVEALRSERRQNAIERRTQSDRTQHSSQEYMLTSSGEEVSEEEDNAEETRRFVADNMYNNNEPILNSEEEDSESGSEADADQHLEEDEDGPVITESTTDDEEEARTGPNTEEAEDAEEAEEGEDGMQTRRRRRGVVRFVQGIPDETEEESPDDSAVSVPRHRADARTQEEGTNQSPGRREKADQHHSSPPPRDGQNI